MREFCECEFVVTTPGQSLPSYLAACLFFQSRPGQFTQASIEAVHTEIPLARLALVLGSWCEGELRSGFPLHGLERMFWYEAPPRIARLLSQAPLPRTFTFAERIELASAEPRDLQRRYAQVVARRHHDRESLFAICEALGWAVISPETATPPEIVFLSADDLGTPELQKEIDRLRTTWPAARLIALLNFPRLDEVESLYSLGCHAVLGQPCCVSDLRRLLPS